MSRSEVSRRVFSLSDQNRFAELSGDFNPVHVDPRAARRTMFGEVVVHGIHILLWALDSYLGNEAGVKIGRIQAVFLKPGLIGADLRMMSTEPGHRLEVVGGSGTP